MPSVVEKEVLLESESMTQVLQDLMANYFVFSIAYLRPINSLFLFLQHHLFNIKDNQAIPNVVKIVQCFVCLILAIFMYLYISLTYFHCVSHIYILFLCNFFCLLHHMHLTLIYFLSTFFITCIVFKSYAYVLNFQAYLCVKKHICQSYTVHIWNVIQHSHSVLSSNSEYMCYLTHKGVQNLNSIVDALKNCVI